MFSARLVVPLLFACGGFDKTNVGADCAAEDSTCASNTAGQALLQRVARVDKSTGPEIDDGGPDESSEARDDEHEEYEGLDDHSGDEDEDEAEETDVAPVDEEADVDEEDIDDYVEDVVNESGETNAAILLDAGELWPQVASGKRCDPRPPLKKWVKTQTACQTIAEENGHVYYQYNARRKKCGTTMTCVKQKSGRPWKIYKTGQSDEEKAEEAKAEAAAAVERAAAAAEKERIGKITESWPRSPWPQCGFGKSRCSMEQVPVRSIMACQNRAMEKGHTHYQYTTPYKHFGLCGTSAAASCERAVPYPWNTGGLPSNWKIYTWGTCVQWTTRTTTTTTTVTQAQNPVDTTMAKKTAVGGCSDPGTRPDSATDAWVAGSALGYGLEKRVFKVPGVPHDPTKHWAYGPGRLQMAFQTRKQFYSVTRADGKEGVVWVDVNNGNVYMTWFAADLKDSASLLLYTPETEETLMAATSNSQDGIVLITAKNALNPTQYPEGRRSEGTVWAVRFDSTSGAQVKKATVPAPHIWKWDDPAGSAAWELQNNTIAFFITKFMPMTDDGKNHQLAIVVLLDGSSLAEKFSHWASSHSFGNTIMRAEGSGDTEKDWQRTNFLGIDVGDNGPRGISVHRWNTYRKAYNFDNRWTDGGAWAISHKMSTPYHMKSKGRNDNAVYSEIAHPGPTEVDDGILVFFLGEQAPLDDTKIGGWLNVPRDIGFAKISSDLRTIISPGATEKGSYPSYHGGTTYVENKGINFLTNFSSSLGEGASRLKTFKLSSGRILLSYEIWTWRDYIRTEMMEVDKDGNVVRGKWDTCVRMRLPPADDPLVRNGKGIAYAGNSEGLIRYEICAGDECS